MKTVCSVLLVGLSLPGLALENAYATPVETAMTQTQDRKVAFTGTVQDSKGEAIVGATILVKGQAKGKGTLTDPKGHFVLSGLKVGSSSSSPVWAIRPRPSAGRVRPSPSRSRMR